MTRSNAYITAGIARGVVTLQPERLRQGCRALGVVDARGCNCMAPNLDGMMGGEGGGDRAGAVTVHGEAASVGMPASHCAA